MAVVILNNATLIVFVAMLKPLKYESGFTVFNIILWPLRHVRRFSLNTKSSSDIFIKWTILSIVWYWTQNSQERNHRFTKAPVMKEVEAHR